ncbi:MAG: oxidoreductase [Sediminibacterium sp.]|jgi:NAD(P)-dependent dehydrogenase (short-subunit alcohol dehydrogenase family)|nr:SDR family NAD(P)-dependent oxidoreductase [Chitinophagaceae bacterium]MCA6445879.1 SDR family NAD(P)-dependent oxidoreductase [Chitinophagaceae bacterium]
MVQKIWFITGISSGLGKALAETVIESGDFVIGTFRNQTQSDAFNNQHKDKALALTLDITNPHEIKNTIQLVSDKFSRVDMLVNNAGFGLAGAIEEASIAEVREIFETNFFGTLQLTQAFLPLFRKHKSGHIIQISSHGGFKAFPGFGIYNASKFALEGFSEALAVEVAPLGIKLTIVEPGPFRTNFAGSSFKQAKVIIDDYSTSAGAFRERMKQVDGKQEGDPIKAAQAIIGITKLDTPPLRLPLGKIAIVSLTAKLESVQNDMDNFRDVAENAVFD